MKQSLSGEARSTVAEIADRHGFKPEAGEAMAEALMGSGGGMAQFNHPDLGGMGQWSKGGMMMIGEMNNDRLKARVGDLARDLSDAVQSGKIAGETRENDTSGSSSSASSSSSSSGASWWPANLGSPSSTGSQNNSRYAVFPDQKRLAVDEGGRVSIYDTGDERIEGASQQQGGHGSMRFSTRTGSVRVEDLKKVEDGGSEEGGKDDVRAERLAGPASPVANSTQPGPASRPASTHVRTGDPVGGRGDAIDTLRRLAALHDDGIITEAEFAAKKAELLARL